MTLLDASSNEGYSTPSTGVRIRLIETNSVGEMKRFGLQISLLALLVMPVVFALGWWARDVNYGHAIDGLQRSIAELNTRHQNDLLLDELRGEWIETSHHRGGVLIDYGIVAGRSVEVSWLLAPEGGSQRSIDASEMETLDLGKFTVDTTKDPAWIDFHSRNGGRPFVCLGIVRVTRGYTDFGSATIALSSPSWDGNPERPASFESTRENVSPFGSPSKNQASVYRLKRDGRY